MVCMPFTFFPLRAPGNNAFSAAGHLSPSDPALHLRFAPTSLPLHSLSVVSFLFDLPHLSHLVALARSFRCRRSGVCGYNGYIPSIEAIPIPTKEGPSVRGAPESNKDRAQPGWEFPHEYEGRLSTYQGTISNGAIAKKRPSTAPIISSTPPRGPVPASPPNEGNFESQV